MHLKVPIIIKIKITRTFTIYKLISTFRYLNEAIHNFRIHNFIEHLIKPYETVRNYFQAQQILILTIFHFTNYICK